MPIIEILKSEFKNFSENWSGHGVHRITISKHIAKKLFYTGVFITSFVLFTYQIRKLMIKYHSYPVNTVVEIHHDAIRFPAITICNKNAVRKSKLNIGGSALQDIVNKSEQAFSKGIEYVGEYGETGSGSGSGSGEGIRPEDADISGSKAESASGSGDENSNGDEIGKGSKGVFHKTKENDWLKAGLQTRESGEAQEISIAVLKVNITSRLEMGHQLSEILQSCSINEETCSTKNFSAFFSARYGNCFTFNGMETTNGMHTFKPGALYGLKMQIVIEQDEYIGAITRKAGARLVVHDPHEFPFPEDNGIDLAPGKVTSVGLKLKVIQLLGPPYSECTRGKKTAYSYAGMYTAQACRRTCLEKNVVQVCNCADTRYSNAELYNTRLCANSTDYKCIKDVVREFHKDASCDCPASCERNVYLQTISTADFPSRASMSEMRQVIMARSDRLKSLFNATNEDITQDLLEVEVFFETLQYEKIKETPAYDFETLLSDVGGQAGLFIGWSVISFVEIFEFLGNLLCIVIKALVFRKTPASDKIIQVTPTQQ